MELVPSSKGPQTAPKSFLPRVTTRSLQPGRRPAPSMLEP